MSESVLHDFLSLYLGKGINVFFGAYDVDDDKYIVMNGTLIDFDNRVIRIREEDGTDTVISLKHTIYIAEGWSEDVLRIEKEAKA